MSLSIYLINRAKYQNKTTIPSKKIQKYNILDSILNLINKSFYYFQY
jgi:hypothetical protein